MNMMLAGTEKSFPLSLPPHFPTIGSIWLLCLRLTTKLCMLSTVVKTIHYTNKCMPSTNLYCQSTGEPMPLVFLRALCPQWTLFSSLISCNSISGQLDIVQYPVLFSLISGNSINRWFITQFLIVNLTSKESHKYYGLIFDNKWILQTSSSKTGQWLTADTLLKTFLNIIVIADKG